MAKKEKGFKKYFFSCLQCGAGGVVSAKNLEDAKVNVRQYHADYHKFCCSECANATFRIHRPLGAVTEF